MRKEKEKYQKLCVNNDQKIESRKNILEAMFRAGQLDVRIG